MTAELNESLNVIALVSGGKDSFFSVLHCLANGHRVVALANLHPPPPLDATARILPAAQGARDGAVTGTRDGGRYSDPTSRNPQIHEPQSHLVKRKEGPAGAGITENQNEEVDLNSFMYQTVGHQVIPLYASMTGLPLFRQPIVGTAVDHGISYGSDVAGRIPVKKLANSDLVADHEQEITPQTDETEVLVPLLRTAMKAHPEANALCAGAILSTYQRTRIESVALRLGLTPLAWLWQFPALPNSGNHRNLEAKLGCHHGRKHRPRLDNDACLLYDMSAAGLEARIVKVASAGLDESFLWQNVTSESGTQRVQQALRRYADVSKGAVLGEGGEFETLVTDGPDILFKGRIVVPDSGKHIVREGGGSFRLVIREASVEMKTATIASSAESSSLSCNAQADTKQKDIVPIPALLDHRFAVVLEKLGAAAGTVNPEQSIKADSDRSRPIKFVRPVSVDRNSSPHLSEQWCFASSNAPPLSLAAKISQLVHDISQRLDVRALPASTITAAIVVLRHMSDFPLLNQHYGTLFQRHPNPPARVTIACGDRLPRGCDIAIYLNVQPLLVSVPEERIGLHVQSRSYWAPANIGPYSQAVTYPLALSLPSSFCVTNEQDKNNADRREDPDNDSHDNVEGNTRILATMVAGQIPLVPALMAFPEESSKDDSSMQIVLALQHLWRVGQEMGVSWWASAVAYFPRTLRPELLRRKCLSASDAWRLAHLWSCAKQDELGDSDDENGPDLWDLRFNPQYAMFSGANEKVGECAGAHPLPDWDLVQGRCSDLSNEDSGEKDARRAQNIPFIFSAEVEELPRSAAVEWHAHMGLSAKSGSGTMRIQNAITVVNKEQLAATLPRANLTLHHAVVESEDGTDVFAHTAAAVVMEDTVDDTSEIVLRKLSKTTEAFVTYALDQNITPKLKALKMGKGFTRPYLTYVDVDAVSLAPDGDGGNHVGDPGPGFGLQEQPVVPCHSLWDSHGQRMGAVLLFQSHYSRVIGR